MAAGNIRVEQLRSRDGFEEFARLPHLVYSGWPVWWPPDVENEIDLLCCRSPISPYLDLAPFVARRDGKPVARLSAVVNRRYVEHWHENVGQLIHFEAVSGEEDAAVALLNEASAWLKGRAMRAARSGFAAFLDYPYAIDNYGVFPSFLLRGGVAYYHRCFKNAGFETEKGMHDYTAALTPQMLARYRSTVEGARAGGVSIRSWREYGFSASVEAWTDITNAAFARHWGWNPVAHAEVRPMLTPLADTAVADLSMVAIADGQTVGAVFSVPDLSAALAQVRPGATIAPERGGGTRGALINIGVLESARGRGIGLAMASRSFLRMAERGMRYAGYTLVLDDNWPSRRTAENLGALITGNFVVYRRELT
ncbi:MAG: GNAT family N-acetyltransferase [Candidatus Binataceae bacterium]